MLQKIETADLQISPVEIPDCPGGYNIGDLLWAPSLRGVDLTDRRFEQWERQRNLVAAHLPNSIVGRYCLLHKRGDRCPNGEYLRQSVAAFGATVDDANILAGANEVCKPSTLCVHLRSGDRPQVSNIVVQFLPELLDCFQSVVIFTGLHSRHRRYERSLQSKMLADTRDHLNTFLDMSDKVKVELNGSADDHLYLISQSTNLLLSKGGFSYLAGMSTKGRIFAPPSVLATPKWMAELHADAAVERL